eukprot:ANDGO_08580.mRNA.1 hypothetical protein NAEGRDRAFT_82606
MEMRSMTPTVGMDLNNHECLIRTAAATVPAAQDGVEYLVREHEEFRAMFERFRKTSNEDLRYHLIGTIVKRVAQHESIEEQSVYPMYRDRLPHGKHIYARALTEGAANRDALCALTNLLSGAHGFSSSTAKFKIHQGGPSVQGADELFFRAAEAFFITEEVHMKQEETWLHQLQSEMTASELESLHRTLVQLGRFTPTHPAPRIPARPLHRCRSLFRNDCSMRPI